MTPALENHSAIERLSFRRDDDAVVLAVCAGVRFAPVKLKSFEFQRVQRNEQVRRPLVTVPAFPEAVIHEEIVEDRRAKHVILPPEPADGGIRAVCQEGRFVLIHTGRK